MLSLNIHDKTQEELPTDDLNSTGVKTSKTPLRYREWHTMHKRKPLFYQQHLYSRTGKCY